MPLAEIHVTLKPALFDAQGETIQKALHQLGHTGVRNARIGKYITLEIEGADASLLQGQLDLMCQQLLANPVIEDYEVTLSGVSPAAFDPLQELPVTATALQTELPSTGAPSSIPSTAPPLPVSAAPMAPVNTASTSQTPANESPAPPVLSPPTTAAPRVQGVPAASATASNSFSSATAPLLSTSPMLSDDAAPIATPANQAKRETLEAVVSSRVPGGAGLAASVGSGAEPVTTPGGIAISDPFTLDFRAYQGLPTEAKLALRTLALRKHGSWIEKQLHERRAAWILCLGHQVVESGPNLDTYPSDQHLLKLGVTRDLVPWVFTRPTA